ncbi:MAG: ABC transporter substrate-binding protein [Fimbriimonadaceae bacterium]|nr:ABC transporter substrate-binding protein [Fimbriimonadaceae bacterium]QYK57564.1 MAG: ABC transporter substrate-binding protein [Fimbriimonadaceae bacterium]
MRFWTGLTASVAALVAIGCQPTEPLIGGEPLAKTVQSVVSLSPSTTEIWGRLPAKMVGRTSSCDMPPVAMEAPIVVQGTKPDYERISQIKPDLVVYDAELYGEADRAKIEELGIKTSPLEATKLEELYDTILKAGSMTGGETVASSTVDSIENAVARASAQKLAKKPRTMVLMVGGGEYMATGRDSFLADVLRHINAEPVGPSGTTFVTISPETLIQDNPDMILVPSGGRQVMADPRLAGLEAIKKRRVFEVTPAFLLRKGPRTKDLVESVANVMAIEFGGGAQ